MSLIHPARGKHTAPHRIAQLQAQLDQADADNRALVAANEDLTRDLAQAVVRSCQDEMRIAVAEEENGRLKARVRKLSDRVIREAAEQARLRQAVINARPRITETVQRLDRPYVSHVQIPYPVPVGRSTANDETQQLAVIDQPEPAVWPVYAMPAEGVTA